MITISSTLQDAAEAESRAPLVGVDIIQKRLNFYVADITTATASVAVHRVVESSGGFWVASGYSQPLSPTSIYAKKINTLLSDTDWEGSWVLVVSGLPNAFVHDLYVDGNNCYIFFWKYGAVSSKPELWQVTSSDGGATWGSPALVYAVSSFDTTWEVQFISALSSTVVWWSAGLDTDEVWQLRCYYDTSWNIFAHYYFIGADMFNFMADSTTDIPKQAFVFMPNEHTERLVFNSLKGFNTGDRWAGVFSVDHHVGRTTLSYVRPALGCLETDLDYHYSLRGVSKNTLGGYYIGGILETYNKYADSDGEEEETEFFLYRTADGKSFQLIPTNINRNTVINKEPEDSYIAGVVSDSDGTIAVVVTEHTPTHAYTNILYSEPTWLTGYETGTAMESDVVEQVNISRSVREISKMSISLTNQGSEYIPGDSIREGNIIRVEAGYKTSSGDELQRRFTGEIVTANETFEPDETTTIDVYDCLYPATLKAGRPHLLFGQNLFCADFSVTDDNKKMVDQEGVWAVSSNRYTQTEKGINAYSICGYDPDDLYSTVVKLRADTSITNVKMGVIVSYDPEELSTTRLYTVICYNQTTDDFEYAYIAPDGSYNLVTTLSSSLGWSADTDYWIKIERQHNTIQCAAYKASATANWTNYLHTQPSELGKSGYTGVFCYVPTSGTSVSFSTIDVASLKMPLIGSDIMEYIAGTCGIGTDEKYVINDEFSGSGFGDDWITGPDGTWSITGGEAVGTGTISAPAEACITTIDATDVVATTYVKPNSSYYAGVSIRSNCDNTRYEGLISASGYIISKVVDGARTVLDSLYLALWVPITYHSRVDFAAIGSWICLFVNGRLVGFARDDSIANGSVGILSASDTSYPSYHDSFIVRGFYSPIGGIVSIDAKDTFISIMDQITDLYHGGQFFSNEDGDLRWGVFPETGDEDLDIESIIITNECVRGLDKIVTAKTMAGNLLYANARVRPWALGLSRHIYDSEDNKFVDSGAHAHDIAKKSILDTYRISESGVSIRANPAIELCDIVVIENGTVYVYDTFTDIASTLLENHTPDIDVVGDGWTKLSTYDAEISSDNTAMPYSTIADCEIDTGITDFTIETDVKFIYNRTYIKFRSNESNFCFISINPSDIGEGIVLGKTFGSNWIALDRISYDSHIPHNVWVHIKVTAFGNNVVAIVAIGNKDYMLYSNVGDMPATHTNVGFYMPDSTTEIDNFIVYTRDKRGQVLSLNETIGFAYEMSLPGLIGNGEYW